MLSLLSEGLSQYVEAHASPEPPLLTELRQRTVAELASPQMQVGRVEGALLKMLVAVSGAKRVLEIGTYSGYSALSMASGLTEGGRLVTCDIDPVATAVAQEFFGRSPYADAIELRLGPAADTLTQMRTDGEVFDLVFIDADKESYVSYYELSLSLLRPGGLIVADNTLWGGKVLAPEHPSDHGIVAFNRTVAQDARVEHVLLPVRDGVMLVRKR